MINEARIRDHLANAVLALSFVANAAQSKEHLVQSGKIESTGMAAMSRTMETRRKANKNLDSPRVSEPARNRKKKTFEEFILECYEISEGSEIAGKLADLAQSKANKLFQGNRQWDPNRAKIQTLTRIADLARARSLDKPEPKYAGMTLPPPGGGGKPADLPPRRPINSRGGSGLDTDPERDRGNKGERLLDFVNVKRDSPNMNPKEQEQRNTFRKISSYSKKRKNKK